MKLAFICKKHLDSFVLPIVDRLSVVHEARLVYPQSHWDITEAKMWADVVWFEWCDDLAIIGSGAAMRPSQRIIIRLHSYEAFTDFPQRVKWQNISNLIVVSPHIIDILEQSIPDIRQKTRIDVIYNGVDLEKFTYTERQPGPNIGMVCAINHKKNLPLMPHIMAELVKQDGRFNLHIAGACQEKRLEIYLAHIIAGLGLQDHIFFDGAVGDVNAWLEDKNYLLSTSIHEGHALNILEAMAKGIKPVVHNYFGAIHTIPGDCLFNSIDNAVAIIGWDEYQPEEYRKWAERFSLDNQILRIRALIEGSPQKQMEDVPCAMLALC